MCRTSNIGLTTAAILWQSTLSVDNCFVIISDVRTAKAELERVNAEESSAREERNKFERDFTMIQHDMKENQRKLELEIEQRQKVEAQLSEVESQLQAEVSARQAALGNSQQSVEKVQQLEKQVFLMLFCRGILLTTSRT